MGAVELKTGCDWTLSFLGAKAKRGNTLHCSVSTATPEGETNQAFRRPEKLSAIAPQNGFPKMLQAAWASGS